ncbi:hypothetical protein [Halomonas caseinilytica]|uniref:hypothetical protein n=1 Tax=Halomonas caseinilytica TaxID=438744 RepID=UPI0010BE51B3|nr:hypothetical protein [Halomonas caseinilytica]
MFIKSDDFLKLLVYSSLLIVLFSGFISNLTRFLSIPEVAGVNYGTLLLFLLVFVGGAYGGCQCLARINSINVKRIILFIVFSCFLLPFIYFAWFTVDELLSLKASVSYFVIPLVFLGVYALCTKRQEFLFLIEKCPIYLALGYSLIGIVQFFLGYGVSEYWLVLHGEDVLGFWELGWVRPTAWVGNTIFFSGLVSVLFFYCFLYAFLRKDRVAFVAAIAALLSIYLAMSRFSVAMVASWIIVMFFILFFAGNKKEIVKRGSSFLAVCFVLAVLCTSYNDYFQERGMTKSAGESKSGSLVIDRFHSDSVHSKGSNEVHAQEARKAIEFILSGKISGWGTQGISAQNSIVSDGLWFQVGIETGFVGIFLFAGWFLLVPIVSFFIFSRVIGIKSVFRSFCLDGSAGMFFIYLAFFVSSYGYFLFAGFVNTSFSSRVTYLILWVMLGAFLARYDLWKAMILNRADK